MKFLIGIIFGAGAAILFMLFWKHSSVTPTNSLIPNSEAGFWAAVANKTIIWSINDASNIYDPKGNKIGTIGLDGTVYDINHNVIIQGLGGLTVTKNS